MRHWNIGLNSWIVQDGNYPDFYRGQIAEFAVEFFPHEVIPLREGEKAVRHLGDRRYQVVAKIVHLTREAWVLDFGIRAFQDAPPPANLTVGMYVTADVWLGVDPYFYFEFLFKTPGMPPLIYTWQVESISQQTAPFIESREPDWQRVLVRDETRLGYKDIERTDAWDDDDGYAEYVLHCSLMDGEPKRTSRTAK